MAASALRPAPGLLPLSRAWPDIRQGAAQIGALGALGGGLLGLVAGLTIDQTVWPVAGRGIMAGGLMGCLAGGLIAYLRAQPSGVPGWWQPSRTGGWQGGVEGAAHGVIIGAVTGTLVIVLQLLINGMSLGSAALGLLMFCLTGMVAGSLVGAVRVRPRDRR